MSALAEMLPWFAAGLLAYAVPPCKVRGGRRAVKPGAPGFPFGGLVYVGMIEIGRRTFAASISTERKEAPAPPDEPA